MQPSAVLAFADQGFDHLAAGALVAVIGMDIDVIHLADPETRNEFRQVEENCEADQLVAFESSQNLGRLVRQNAFGVIGVGTTRCTAPQRLSIFGNKRRKLMSIIQPKGPDLRCRHDFPGKQID